MMVPKSLFLAGVALALAGASSAQSQSGKVFARYNKPLRSVTLDLETGTLTRGPQVVDKKVGTCSDFANIDLGGFVGVDTGNKFCEWLDAGTKGTACVTDMMRSIVFAYCSAKASVGSGGPGGSVRLGFYEGYALGGGVPTTAVAVFTLTGLPGNSASSSFFGGFLCYFIRVNFNPVINFADGAIGYGWHFVDVGADGVLAGTWPFLSCVQSCSGTGPDGIGMVDQIDEYCPSGTFPPRATFSFGTTPFGSYFTSISMRIEELAQNNSVVGHYNGDQNCNKDAWTAPCPGISPVPVNPPVTVAGGPCGATLGGTWQPRVQLQSVGVHVPAGPAPNGHGASGPCRYLVFTGNPTANNGACPNAFFTAFGVTYNRRVELQVLGGSGPNPVIVGSHNGSLTSIAAQTIPMDVSFLCVGWATFADFPVGTKDRSSLLYGIVGNNP